MYPEWSCISSRLFGIFTWDTLNVKPLKLTLPYLILHRRDCQQATGHRAIEPPGRDGQQATGQRAIEPPATQKVRRNKNLK